MKDKETKESFEKEYSERSKHLKKSLGEQREKVKEVKSRIQEGERLGLETSGYKEQLRNVRTKQVGTNILKAGSYAERTGSRLSSAFSKALKQKILKKPSAKVPSYSNKQLIKNLSGSDYRMFKSEPRNYQEQPVQDNRSIFFNAEFNKEVRRL